MTRTVRLPAPLWLDILQHARDAVPEECCGLLLGLGDDVADAIRTRNISPDPTRRFLVNPAEHFETLRRARAAGLSVIGAYHSHPRGAARPSETDRTEAWPDDRFVHLIVDPRRDEIAAYSLTEGNFVPLQLVRVA